MKWEQVVHAMDQGPWGRKNSSGGSSGNGGGWPPSGRGKGPGNPNEFDVLLRELKQWLEKLFGPNTGNRGILIALLVFFLLWLASGIYQVQPGEQGVVMRFGKFNRVTASGLSYHLPAPFESVEVVNTEALRMETISESAGLARNGASPEEMLMLTGDENIINLRFNVTWNVGDVQDYIFNVPNPDQTVRSVAESAMREVVGHTTLESILTEGKSKVQEETRQLAQEILNRYRAGIHIERVSLNNPSFPDEVVEAAHDVQAARADQERLRNEAEAYTNDILPRARGQAERMVQDAEGYKKEVVARAEGDAARFLSIYAQYTQAEGVTRKRMYLETMEKILSGMNKMVIDTKNGAVPYLPLPGLTVRGDEKKESR